MSTTQKTGEILSHGQNFSQWVINNSPMTTTLSSRRQVVYKISHLIQDTRHCFTDLVDYPIHYIHKEKNKQNII